MNNHTHTSLERSVMRRVYTLWALRTLMSSFAVKLYAFVTALALLAREVSIPNIFYNAPSFLAPLDTARFFSSAFWGTELAVQIYLGLFLLVFFSLATSIFQKGTLFSGRHRAFAR